MLIIPLIIVPTTCSIGMSRGSVIPVEALIAAECVGLKLSEDAMLRM